MRGASGLRTKRRIEEQERPWAWSWLHFTFAFVIAGVTAFLKLGWGFDDLWLHLLKTVTIASVCGALAGRFGDWAWRGIVSIIRWT